MIDLKDFRDKIAAKLLAEGCNAQVLFGRSHLNRQDNQGPGTANRVIISPGRPEDDDWGTLSVGKKAHVRAYPGEAQHSEMVTLDVWAYDGSAATDEAVQYRALRVLWNRVVRAVGTCLREGGHESSTWWGSNARLLKDPADRRHGERARVTFTIDFDIRSVAPTVDVTGATAAPPTAEVEA